MRDHLVSYHSLGYNAGSMYMSSMGDRECTGLGVLPFFLFSIDSCFCIHSCSVKYGYTLPYPLFYYSV